MGQRIFARPGWPTVELELFPLIENLRNTKQIAGTFSSLAPGMKVCGCPSSALGRLPEAAGHGLAVDAADRVQVAADDEQARRTRQDGDVTRRPTSVAAAACSES